ncbi:hypothetical protein [Actinomadura verrucosospora]
MNDSLRTLKDFFAAEAAYVTAGGPGKADFSGMAAHLHPDVVMYQAERACRTGVNGPGPPASSPSWRR